MAKTLEKLPVNSDASELASLKKEIAKSNQEKSENFGEDFNSIVKYIRSHGKKIQKWETNYYDLESINYKWKKINLRLEEWSNSIVAEIFSKNNKNKRERLCRLTKNQNNSFDLQERDYQGDPKKPKTYNFTMKNTENLDKWRLKITLKEIKDMLQLP